MKWLLFVIYVGASGVPRMEPVSTFAEYATCKAAAREFSRTMPNGRYDCTWYRRVQR